ncbi:hypothetical protein Tco_1207181, partial [Tanacetum coccineum]
VNCNNVALSAPVISSTVKSMVREIPGNSIFNPEEKNSAVDVSVTLTVEDFIWHMISSFFGSGVGEVKVANICD